MTNQAATKAVALNAESVPKAAAAAVHAGLSLQSCPLRAGDDDVLSIGEVARRFGVTVRALRFYESRRLIAPQRHGAIRLYRRADCERLGLVLTGRRLGFTLAEIGDLLNRPDGAGLRLTRTQCVAQIDFLERQKRGIEIAISELRQIYTSFYRTLIDPSA
ncbi:MAG: MerR family transcriptional regulator [Hyphomicrobiales bacterium]|nr:MerR family transcriptional regulator [Hyphomicrobiales bacterium]